MTATGPASPHYVEDAVDIIRKVPYYRIVA